MRRGWKEISRPRVVRAVARSSERQWNMTRCSAGGRPDRTLIGRKRRRNERKRWVAWRFIYGRSVGRAVAPPYYPTLTSASDGERIRFRSCETIDGWNSRREQGVSWFVRMRVMGKGRGYDCMTGGGGAKGPLTRTPYNKTAYWIYVRRKMVCAQEDGSQALCSQGQRQNPTRVSGWGESWFLNLNSPNRLSVILKHHELKPGWGCKWESAWDPR